MQLRVVPVTATELGSEDPELDQEAEWIFKHAFNDKPISTQVSRSVSPPLPVACPPVLAALSHLSSHAGCS